MRYMEAMLRAGLGRSYGRSGDDTTDCARFVLEVLELVHPNAPWTPEIRRDLLISHGEADRPWSPIDALDALGVDRRGPSGGRGWYLLQGWSGLATPRNTAGAPHAPMITPASRGHQWFVRLDEVERCLVVEATTSGKPWCRSSTWADEVLRFDGVVAVHLGLEVAV